MILNHKICTKSVPMEFEEGDDVDEQSVKVKKHVGKLNGGVH